VTPIIIAIAVVAAVVVVLCVVMVIRSRYDDEGERFRHVADLTSAWSRETHPMQQPEPPPSKGKRTTESVDTR
jgi:hypothetical protein